jgi:hypothetical protein
MDTAPPPVTSPLSHTSLRRSSPPPLPFYMSTYPPGPGASRSRTRRRDGWRRTVKSCFAADSARAMGAGGSPEGAMALWAGGEYGKKCVESGESVRRRRLELRFSGSTSDADVLIVGPTSANLTVPHFTLHPLPLPTSLCHPSPLPKSPFFLHPCPPQPHTSLSPTRYFLSRSARDLYVPPSNPISPHSTRILSHPTRP